jgi:hypothetical protein
MIFDHDKKQLFEGCVCMVEIVDFGDRPQWDTKMRGDTYLRKVSAYLCDKGVPWPRCGNCGKDLVPRKKG